MDRLVAHLVSRPVPPLSQLPRSAYSHRSKLYQEDVERLAKVDEAIEVLCRHYKRDSGLERDHQHENEKEKDPECDHERVIELLGPLLEEYLLSWSSPLTTTSTSKPISGSNSRIPKKTATTTATSTSGRAPVGGAAGYGHRKLEKTRRREALGYELVRRFGIELEVEGWKSGSSDLNLEPGEGTGGASSDRMSERVRMAEGCTDPDYDDEHDLASFTFTLRPMIPFTLTLPTGRTTTAIPTPPNPHFGIGPANPEPANSIRSQQSLLTTSGKSAGPGATRTLLRDGDGRAGGVEGRDANADADGDKRGHGDEDGHDPERRRATRIRLCLWQLLHFCIGTVGLGPGNGLESGSGSVLSAWELARASTPPSDSVSALLLSASRRRSPSDPNPSTNPHSNWARPSPPAAGPSALSGSEARAEGSGAPSSPRARPESEVRLHDQSQAQGQAQSLDGPQSLPGDQPQSQLQPSLSQTSMTDMTKTNTMDMDMTDTNTNTNTVTNMNTDTDMETKDTDTNNTNTDGNMKDTNMPDTSYSDTNIPDVNTKNRHRNTHTNTDPSGNTPPGVDTTPKSGTTAFDRTVEPINTMTTASIGRTSDTIPIMTSASKSCRITDMIPVSEFCALIISHYRARQTNRSRQPQKESDVQSRIIREGTALFSLDELKSDEKGQRETETSGPTDTARREEGVHREGVVVDPSLEAEGRGIGADSNGPGGMGPLSECSDRNPGRKAKTPSRMEITSTGTGGRIEPYNDGITSAISREEVPGKRPAPNSSEVGDADGLVRGNKRRRLESGPSIRGVSASTRQVEHGDGANRAGATRGHGETDYRIGDQHRENVDDEDHDDKGGTEKWVARCQNIETWFCTSIDVWYARSETLLPAKEIHTGSIGRNWGKGWQDRFFSGLSMMDRNGDDNGVETGEPRETLTEESTSVDTWKKISQISGFCDLDAAVKLLRIVQGGRKSFPVRKLKDLAMHLKARGVEETFQVYTSKDESRATFHDRPDPPPTSIPSTEPNHFEFLLGDVPHWPECSDENAGWLLDADEMHIDEILASSEGDAGLCVHPSNNSLPLPSEGVNPTIGRLRIGWMEKDTHITGASPADAESARIYKILASASSIKGARNRIFSPWYDAETAELTVDRWDQAPVVLISGPGKMLNLGVPKCSLSAEQVDRLEAASPEDFQETFRNITEQSHDLGEMRQYFEKQRLELCGDDESSSNDAMQKIWQEAGVATRIVEIDGLRRGLYQRVMRVQQMKWGDAGTLQEHRISMTGTLLSVWAGFALMMVRSATELAGPGGSRWMVQLCTPWTMIAIPPNVHWAWYNLTRTAVMDQHFDHCRLLPHAFQAWQNLEMTKPWTVLKPSIRISVRQANLEALVRAMLTTLWALYDRPRSGPIRDRFLPPGILTRALLCYMEDVLSLRVLSQTLPTTWEGADQLDLEGLVTLACTAKPLVAAKLKILRIRQLQ